MYGMLALLIVFILGYSLWTSDSKEQLREKKTYYKDLNNTLVKAININTSKEYAKQFNKEYKELKKKNKKGV